MKRILSILFPILLTVSLIACGSKTELAQENSEPQTNIVTSFSREETKTDFKAEISETKVAGTEITETENTRNILIAYFSRWGNTDFSDDVDATTSASIVIDNNTHFGTTEYVANQIANVVGGDLHRIETVTPYTTDFDELRDVNHEEMNQNYLPALKESNLDISQYDTVFIGYPVWATEVPQAVISFLTTYDLSGKTIIPFCTHDGYGAGSSYGTISEASHAGEILEGIAIEASDVSDSEDAITQWLTSIGMSDQRGDKAEHSETPIKITIGDIVLDGVFYETALSKEIMEKLPLTVSMVGYGGREYYGGIDFTPQNIDGGQLQFENGDITYCNTNNTMAIFYAQTDRPNLTMEVIPIGRVTSDLLVFDTLGSREEVTFSLAQ